MERYFTADSFGSECPVNWEEICDALNALAEERDLLNNPECDPDKDDALRQIWEDYFNGDLPDIPAPKMHSLISLDNGHSYMTAKEAMPEIVERNLWDAIVDSMNDDIRELVCQESDWQPTINHPEYDQEMFLTRYLELDPNDMIIG